MQNVLLTQMEFVFLGFRRLAKDFEPFPVQYYSRANTLVYNHPVSGSNENGTYCSMRNVLENNYLSNFKYSSSNCKV